MCEALRAWHVEDTGEVEPSYDRYPPVPLRFFSPEVKSAASISVGADRGHTCPQTIFQN